MSKNTITIEGKNGIMLMIPYKSISYHKRKGNYYHCKGTGNAEETINVDDIQEHWKCAETPPKGDPVVHMY